MIRRKNIFVCSPYRGHGDTPEAVKEDRLRNVRLARAACRYILGCGHYPYAPHLYFTHFLNDSDPDERDLGMQLGRSWLKQCDELWVIGYRVSEGMKAEIVMAKKLGIPVKHYVYKRTPEERLLDAILRPEIQYHEMDWKSLQKQDLANRYYQNHTRRILL